MEINFYTEETTLPDLNYDNIKLWINDVINSYNYKTGIITIIFSSSEYIQNVNNQFLNHNYPTDIITFDYSKKNIISGDLLICPEVAFENSKIYSTTNILEIHRVIIHGILHLIGFNDLNENDQIQMKLAEDKALSIIGL